MDPQIFALLTQDGVTNGAIYALLALALVLVFTVTRVIWVPSGEYVAYGTLTLAGLQLGRPPGTVGLLARHGRHCGGDGALFMLEDRRSASGERIAEAPALFVGGDTPGACRGAVYVVGRAGSVAVPGRRS